MLHAIIYPTSWLVGWLREKLDNRPLRSCHFLSAFPELKRGES